MPDIGYGSSEAGDRHYREEVYCGSHYGKEEEDEEAVLLALTSKHPGLLLPDVKDLNVARFREAKRGAHAT